MITYGNWRHSAEAIVLQLIASDGNGVSFGKECRQRALPIHLPCEAREKDEKMWEVRNVHRRLLCDSGELRMPGNSKRKDMSTKRTHVFGLGF